MHDPNRVEAWPPVLAEAQVERYLGRIGLAAKPAPTLAGLTALQRAHMQAVPFENLDVYLRRPLRLGVGDLFAKIVGRRRGGYCFELNTLYAALLRGLGFAEVTPVLARVWLRDPPKPPTRNHLAQHVRLGGGRYLTDVGFGGLTARVPVPLDGDDGAPLDDGEGRVRLRRDARWGRMLERELDGAWQPQYSFDATAVARQDALAANHFMETHPASHFRENLACARFTERGRRGLWNGQLTERVGPVAGEAQPVAAADLLATLRGRFGVELGELTEAERTRLGLPT